jgi:hypothetical protein
MSSSTYLLAGPVPELDWLQLQSRVYKPSGHRSRGRAAKRAAVTVTPGDLNRGGATVDAQPWMRSRGDRLVRRPP